MTPIKLSEAIRESERRGIPYIIGDNPYETADGCCALGCANKVMTGSAFNATPMNPFYNQEIIYNGRELPVFSHVYDWNKAGMSRAEIATILEGYGL